MSGTFRAVSIEDPPSNQFLLNSSSFASILMMRIFKTVFSDLWNNMAIIEYRWFLLSFLHQRRPFSLYQAMQFPFKSTSFMFKLSYNFLHYSFIRINGLWKCRDKNARFAVDLYNTITKVRIIRNFDSHDVSITLQVIHISC